MKASAWEFKYRMWLSFGLIALGFAAPWTWLMPVRMLEWMPEWIRLGPRGIHAWGWLAFQLGGLGISSAAGFALVSALAIAAAALGAALRVWGTAYLGAGTVFNAEMKAGPEINPGEVLADGPYRYMRNPLYTGSYLTIVALAILMPPSGAAVALLLLAVFLLRLILGEEAFLTPRLGEPYAAYRRAVPRLLPSLWPRVPASRQTPRWGRALLGESFPIGVAIGFAALSWQYNPELLTQVVLVSFGISLVARAFIVPKSEPSVLG